MLGFGQKKFAKPFLEYPRGRRTRIAVFAKDFSVAITCNDICASEFFAGDKTIDPFPA